MIKKYFFPVSFDVATFTLVAKVAFVLVVFLVTRQTVHRQFFLHIAFVATAAFGSQMFA